MVRGRIILYWSQTPLKLSGPLKWSGRCRARVAQTARNCHRQRDKTARGVLAPLTNVLGRKRPRSLLPSSSDSDVNSDGDEDIQPVGARVGHRYTPRPIYILRSSFRYNHGARDAALLRSHREETPHEASVAISA